VPTFWWTLTELIALALGAQVSMRPDRPNEFWPVSITGWVTLISSSIALGIVIWRANNKPVLDRLTGLEHKFDTEVRRIEKRLDEGEAHRERDGRNLIQAVDEKINGFGRRVQDNRDDINRLEQSQSEIALQMVESQGDRRNMNNRITELTATVSTLVRQLPDLELRLQSSLNQQTKEILKEFSSIMTRNGPNRPR
jgi:chromosome segregation ATPase